jgi:hypothetical protein
MSSQPRPAGPIPAFGPTVTLLVLVVVVDLIFIGIHALHAWSPWLSGAHFSLESENGLASMYQYIKQIWLAGCLALAFLQTRSLVIVGWTLLFTFLLLDDVLQLHERSGDVIAAALNLPAVFGMRPDDLGEMSVAAAIGCIALALMVSAFRRGNSESRELSADLMCLLAALALFGVCFDMLHTITIFAAPSIAPVLALVEDGGEMLVVSVITAYVFDLTSNAGRPRLRVWSRVRGAVARA